MPSVVQARSGEPQRRGRYRLQPLAVDVSRRGAGEANLRGRLERPTRVFSLRTGLVEKGALPFSTAVALVTADWDRQVAEGRIDGIALRGYRDDLARLERLMGALGLHEVRHIDYDLLLRWIHSPGTDGNAPSENTTYRRRSSARVFFETAHCLGITDTNPAKSVHLEQRSDRYVHAYTDTEIGHLQATARFTLTETVTPCALALVMSGSSTREAGYVTVRDVDMERGIYWSHGGGYRWRERWLPFADDWCRDAVSLRIRALTILHGPAAADRWLVFNPKSDTFTEHSQNMVGGNKITALLKKARLHRQGVTRAESIREWLAQSIFAETGSLEEVAARLGMRSLDAAAHIVGYDWLNTSGFTMPPPPHRLDGES